MFTCFAISSRCFDNLHVLFGDVDIEKNITNLSNLQIDLRNLQIDYNIPDIYILESEHGYNFFSLGKHDVNTLVIMLETIEYVDTDFILLGKNRKYFTLRIDLDKIFKTKLINKKKSNTKQSLAHKIFFENLLDIKIWCPYWLNDGSTKFSIVEYPSSKNGYFYREGEIEDEFSYTRR